MSSVWLEHLEGVTSDPELAATVEALSKRTKAVSLADPFAGAHVAIGRALGAFDAQGELFSYWLTRAAGNPRSEMRYRFELSHRRGVPMPEHAPEPAKWRAWRSAEQSHLERDPFAFEQRLALPVVLAENAELLREAAGQGDETARALLAEALPALRRDFAAFAQALDPWQDTFALRCLTRRPRALEALAPIAVAIATSYTAIAEGGPVRGLRFPFHEVPLVSASAALASGLVRSGGDSALVATLADWVLSQRNPDGGWSDGDSASDVITSFLAVELALGIDPDFDFDPTRDFLLAVRRGDGLWRGLGPEALWLSAEIAGCFARARRPFARRFRFPHLAAENRDRKTGLPFYAYFADLARLFAAVRGLAHAPVELAFIDLIGFRAFNNAFGQDRGDEVLGVFARELSAIENVATIRDGGDEFLVLAPPGRRALTATLEAFRRAWPARFREHFGADVPPVAPRILIARAPGRELARLREELGRGITALKGVECGPEGILRDASSGA